MTAPPGAVPRDAYFRQAKDEGWRARSAYKLIHLDEMHGLFGGVGSAVDLCAAPGSWSQALRRLVPPGGAVIAVDIAPMAPLEGVVTLQGDITSAETAERIVGLLPEPGKCGAVVCDGAPEVTGMAGIDEYLQADIVVHALRLAVRILQEGGVFVAKVFRGNTLDAHLAAGAGLLFDEVHVSKPESSRPASLEHFLVCKGFRGGAGGRGDRAMRFLETGDFNILAR